MAVATVIIPTHDHGPLLRYALDSVLAQTVVDLEIVVVGDGIPAGLAPLVREICSRDRRIRLVECEKGRRLGEQHRHAVLAEACGRIVCYLSDDDLWLPDHVESMDGLLEEADWAHSLSVHVDATADRLGGFSRVDHADPRDRAATMGGASRVCLSCGAHTMAAYRRLPHGWRPAPVGTYSDLHMWQQFLAEPTCRPVSGTRPTALNFASCHRRGWSLERREAELAHWAERIGDSCWRAEFLQQLIDQSYLPLVHAQRNAHEEYTARLALQEQLATADQSRADLRAELAVARQAQDNLRAELASERQSQESLQAELAAGRQSQEGMQAELASERQSQESLQAELAAGRQSQEGMQAELAAGRQAQEGLQAELASAEDRCRGAREELERVHASTTMRWRNRAVRGMAALGLWKEPESCAS